MRTHFSKILLMLFFASCIWCCKNSISPVDDERLYVIETIQGLTVEEFTNRYNVHEWPLAFKIKIIPADTTYHGSANLAKLGWLQIKNWEKYTGNDSSFYVDTKGKLGPVEYIDFLRLEITYNEMKGLFQCAGPTIDTGAHYFRAVADN
jgi:hypothetical protein